MNSDLDKDVAKLIVELEEKMEFLEPLREICSHDWKTKGHFQLPNGEVVNLRRADKNEVVKLTNFIFQSNKSIKKTIDFLNIDKEEESDYLLIQGYNVEDWLKDLKKRWDFLNLREREKVLKDKLEKANKLLSEEAKKRIELENISK